MLVPIFIGKEVTGSTPVFSTNQLTDMWAFFMGYYVYIIYSEKLDKYYVGQTDSLETRLEQHNTGLSTFTSKATDWVIKYTEEFENRALSVKREREIKSKKSRKYIEWLINK